MDNYPKREGLQKHQNPGAQESFGMKFKEKRMLFPEIENYSCKWIIKTFKYSFENTEYFLEGFFFKFQDHFEPIWDQFWESWIALRF